MTYNIIERDSDHLVGGMKLLQFVVGSGQKVCAACKFWNDPANSAITPKMRNLWLFDQDVKNKCLRSGCDRKANMGCPYFECKLPRV